jgi:predicted DCC family thiol-disulfide oxidoreductase YuxK
MINNMTPIGWVLYDGACGFCSWWIPFWRKTINRTGYDIAPLQAGWVKEQLNEPEELVNKDIVLLFNDGRKLIGADAYIFGMKTVWWSAPAGYLLSLPGFKQATWLFYKIFNRNRFFVSKVCRLKPILSPTGELKSN